MPDSLPFETLSVEPVSTVDRVAEELRRALFDGELEPGTALREVALAASLGVSRSTVREAVGMLVADGLVDRIPNKGTSVHTLTEDGIRDICRARLVLETAGVSGWDAASEEARQAVRDAQAVQIGLHPPDQRQVRPPRGGVEGDQVLQQFVRGGVEVGGHGDA